MPKKKRRGNRFLKGIRYVLGLVCLLQIDMMYWDVYWNAANRNDLWIPPLGLSKYLCFCMFWIGVFLALTLDLWVGLARYIREWLRG